MRKSFLKKIRLVSLFAVLTVVGCAYGMSDEGQPQQNGEQLQNGTVHHEQNEPLPEQQPRQLTLAELWERPWPELLERLDNAIRAAIDAIPEK